MTRMTRGEMQEAVTVLPRESEEFDFDLESSFDQFREDLQKSQTEATLRVFRIPTNEKGIPVPNAQNQAELFSAPIDLYSLEEVVNRVRREFMRPEERAITVRLLGTRKRTDSERGGVKFNRIVTIEKGITETATGKESMADLFHIVQESADKQVAMLERVLGGRQQENPLNLALQLNQAMTAMLAPILAAITSNSGASRSSTKELMENLVILKGLTSDGGGGLKQRLEEITLLKGLASDLGGDGGNEDGDTPAGIIKAASPLVGPVMEAFAATQKNQAEARAFARERFAARQRRLAASAGGMSPLRSNPRVAASAENSPSSDGDAVSALASTEENIMLKTIREQLETLTQVAAENGDPVPLAETIIGMMPENYDDQMIQFLEGPNCLKVLQSLHPKVKENLEWFESFRQACLAQFNPADGDAESGEFESEHELSPQAETILESRDRLKK